MPLAYLIYNILHKKASDKNKNTKKTRNRSCNIYPFTTREPQGDRFHADSPRDHSAVPLCNIKTAEPKGGAVFYLLPLDTRNAEAVRLERERVDSGAQRGAAQAAGCACVWHERLTFSRTHKAELAEPPPLSAAPLKVLPGTLLRGGAWRGDF